MKNYDIVNTPHEYSIICPLISGSFPVSDCEKCVYHLSAGVDYKEDLLGNIDFDNYSQLKKPKRFWGIEASPVIGHLKSNYRAAATSQLQLF